MKKTSNNSLELHISLSDKTHLNRLYKILKINIAPQFIIIGVQTDTLLYLFKDYLKGLTEFDYIFEDSEKNSYQQNLRQYFKENNRKNFLFILSNSKTQKIIHSLLINRDIIIKKEHIIIILCKSEIYKILYKDAYDLVSYANFSHIFYDISLDDLSTINKNNSQNIDYDDLIRIYNISKNLRHIGNFKKALEILNKGLSYLNNFPKSNKETKLELKYNFYKSLAKTYFAQGLNQRSIKYFNKVLSIHKQHPEIQSKRTIQIYIRKARALKELGEYQEAYKLYTQALKEAKEKEYFKGISMALGELMYLELINNNYDKILEYNNERIQYYKKTFQDINKDLPEMGYVWRDLGNIFANQGSIARAIENYEKAITIFHKNNMYRNIAKIYLLIGNLYYRFFRISKALSIYRKALDLAKRKNILDLQVDALNEISKIYHFMGNISLAMESLSKAYKIAKENLYYKGLTKNFFYLSYLSSTISSFYPQYIKHFNELLDTNKDYIYNKSDGIKYKTFYLLSLIKFFYRNNPSKVIELGNKAKKMSKKNNHYENMIHSYYSIGRAWLTKKDFNNAKKCFQEGLRISKENNFIIGRILNEFYYYKPELTPEISTSTRLQKILNIKNLATDGDFIIFLPRIYEALYQLSSDEISKNLYQKKFKELYNSIKENIPEEQKLIQLLNQFTTSKL